MKTINLILLSAILLVAGCGSGGDKTPTKPTQPDSGVRSEAEPNDFVAQALGALSTTDFVVAGSTVSASDVDLYRVTSTSSGSLLVNLNWNTPSDLDLTVSNSNGIFVRYIDTAGHPESCTLSGLPSGTYTIRVGSLSDAATNYSLTLGQR